MMSSALVLLLSSCSVEQSSEPWAAAYQIEDLSQGIGGPKALAQPGDFVIENDRIRVAILGGRDSMGPHTAGGSVIDADLQRVGPENLHGNGNDLLAEMFPTVSLNVAGIHTPTDYVLDPGTVEVINDGSDGGAAWICAEGAAEPFISMLGTLFTFVKAGTDYRIRTDYILQPGDGALLMRTSVIFGGEPGCGELAEATPAETSDDSLAILDLVLEDGVALGDFYLQGGSIDVFAPDIGFDEDGYVYEQDLADRNLFTDPISLDYLAGTGDGTSYALLPVQGKLFVPLFTASQTAPFGAATQIDWKGDNPDGLPPEAGTLLSYERWFSVGQGDVGSALAAALEAAGVETGSVAGYVVEQGTGVALSDVHVFAYRAGAEAPWAEWRTDVGLDGHPDGSFSGVLPPGDYELLAYAEGRPIGERVPVTITAGGSVNTLLQSPQPGSVRFEVLDETGLPVPSKVTFFAAPGTDDPRDPVLGDGFIAGSPADVVFAPYGSGQTALPPGRYYAIASRGIEYEIDVSPAFTVDDDLAVDLELSVQRVVDTSGWVSADLHVHAVPSHDSGVSLQDRVGTMIAEGVEFISSNDHDYITDYAPVIEDMGVETWISSAVGLEVTTIELGHFLGFPVGIDNVADAGGAVDWTGKQPLQILDELYGLGKDAGYDPVVFVAHPRDGILGYFDQYGFDPYTGDVKTPLLSNFNSLLAASAYTTEYDALEVLNSKRFELIRTPTQPELNRYAADPASLDAYEMVARTMDEQQDLEDGTFKLGYGHEGQVDDWFTLLNMGYRYTALGNSDTHSKTTTEAGCPRNYVYVDNGNGGGVDDPAFLDDQAVADAVRAGRVITTYGPFIRFFADEPKNGPGSEITGGGPVELHIEVSSPSWFGVDRVELYENGTLISEWTTCDEGDDCIANVRGDPVNLSTTTTVEPTKDSWYAVIALGSDDMAPVFTPVEIPHIQLQDVVTDALSDSAVGSFLSPGVPIPRAYPIYPFGLTNPVYVDVAGDGWTPPGLPSWLSPPEEPEGARR